MRAQTSLTLLAALLGLAVVGLFGWSVWQREQQLSIPRRQHAAPAVRSTDPILGNSDAPITLIEFGDFECPACRLAEPQLRVLMARFENDVRLVWKDFPLTGLHAASAGAAEAARCAQQQNAFWQMHDALFARQGQFSDTLYEQLAVSLGLDVQRFRSCMATHATQPLVAQSRAEGEAAGLDGTPAFFLNGQYGTSAPSEEYLRSLLAAP